jgi:AMMECR1 domain-containing protein
VLTKPEPLSYNGPDDLLGKLVPGRDGVILSKGMHQSTYLPQVWEQLPDKVAFLEQLSMKAGIPRDGWKNAEVKTYRAIHFSE